MVICVVCLCCVWGNGEEMKWKRAGECEGGIKAAQRVDEPEVWKICNMTFMSIERDLRFMLSNPGLVVLTA